MLRKNIFFFLLVVNALLGAMPFVTAQKSAGASFMTEEMAEDKGAIDTVAEVEDERAMCYAARVLFREDFNADSLYALTEECLNKRYQELKSYLLCPMAQIALATLLFGRSISGKRLDNMTLDDVQNAFSAKLPPSPRSSRYTNLCMAREVYNDFIFKRQAYGQLTKMLQVRKAGCSESL